MNTAHAFIQPGTTLFRILDGIADATNILLAICLLLLLISGSRRGLWGRRTWLASLLCIAVVYVVKVIEKRLDIWESFGSDYSTHSALAVALAISLCFLERSRRALVLGVFVAYEVLIFLLGFHSLLDIVSTLVVVVPLMLLCWKLLRPLKVENTSQNLIEPQ